MGSRICCKNSADQEKEMNNDDATNSSTTKENEKHKYSHSSQFDEKEKLLKIARDN